MKNQHSNVGDTGDAGYKSNSNTSYTNKAVYNGGAEDTNYTIKAGSTGYNNNPSNAGDTDYIMNAKNESNTDNTGSAIYSGNASNAQYGPGDHDLSFDSFGSNTRPDGFNPGGHNQSFGNPGQNTADPNLDPALGVGCVGFNRNVGASNAEYGNFGPPGGMIELTKVLEIEFADPKKKENFGFEAFLHGNGEDTEFSQVQDLRLLPHGVAPVPYPNLDETLSLPGDAVTHDFDNNSISHVVDGATTQDVDANSNNHPTASGPNQTIGVRNGRIVKIYKQPHWNLNTALKHTPLAPKGTKFRWEDNTHIPRKPVVKARVELDKLRFEVKDSNGDFHERFFHRINEHKWHDTHWVSDANKWRSQAIRRLFKADPEFKTNEIREKWTEEETSYFKFNVLAMVKKNQRQMVAKDWKELADQHNLQFFGSGVTAAGVPSNKAHGLRTATGMRTKYKRFPDLIAQVTEVVTSLQGGIDDVMIKFEENE